MLFYKKKARKKGEPVKGFETLEYQAQTIFGEPLSRQAKGLLKTIRHFDKMKMYLIEMCDAYLRQDLNNLLKIMEAPELGSTPEEMDALVYKRNHNWNKQLKDILSHQPTFSVVGAGHLPGNERLIELLRGEGYSLTPYLVKVLMKTALTSGINIMYKLSNAQMKCTSIRNIPMHLNNGYYIQLYRLPKCAVDCRVINIPMKIILFVNTLVH